jgi:hypothetical protein
MGFHRCILTDGQELILCYILRITDGEGFVLCEIVLIVFVINNFIAKQ